MSNHADFKWIFIHVNHVRANQHATDINHQLISKSIAGNNSKSHLAVDVNRNPIEFIIGDGTTSNKPALKICYINHWDLFFLNIFLVFSLFISN